MAEDKEKKSTHGEGCMCMGCGGRGMMGGGMGMGGYGGRGGHWTFFLLRTLLTILILMVVFWFGVQVGRMNGYGRDSYRMMRMGSYPTGVAMPGGTDYNPGGPMIPVGATSSMPMAQ